MRIGEAAAAAELTPRALRYYEQRGLLAARRTPSGHREYDEADVHWLRIVRELLAAGLTIADVQALETTPAASGVGTEDDPSSCPVVEITVRRLADLDQRIKRLTEVRERLTNALDHRFGELFGRLERDSEKAA
jgi:MerR family transcriptional regulator, copper efflux regulator